MGNISYIGIFSFLYRFIQCEVTNNIKNSGLGVKTK